MRKPAIAMIMLIAFMGSACNSGGGGSSSDGSVVASPSGASEAASASCPAGVTATDFSSDTSFTITTKKDYAFHPDCFIAKSGSTITIKNEDAEAHNFSIVQTEVDLTVPSGEDRSQAVALSAGTYDFYCNIHQGMTGTMIVV
jgi:plastocyanin